MTAPRIARGAVGLLAALVLLAGCSVTRLPGAAAIVDGTVISTQDVATATEQINSVIPDTGQQFTQTQTVYWLVIAPFVNEVAAATGRWTPDAAYNSVLASIPDPSDDTVAVLKARSAANVFTQEDIQQVLARMDAADIQIDPRYGTIDPKTGGWSKPDPNWIKATPTQSPTP